MNIAVLIPCYNEEKTIAKVINDFHQSLPEALIYVYDNNSTDKTYEIAARNNAIVKKEFRQGKGCVVRSMFREIEADFYIIVDGDDTYPAEAAHQLMKPLLNSEADMVVGDRISNFTYRTTRQRPFHNFGNSLVKTLINRLFRVRLKDIMSGYRAFNRNFVKNTPVLCKGFEVESEITLHALDKNFLIKEVPIVYQDRPEGSFSKLSTLKDGLRVLNTIFSLFKDYKPLVFFTFIFLISFLSGLGVGIPVIKEFIDTRYITKVPSAILAVGFVVFSFIALTCGIILDTIVKQHHETYELNLNYFMYLEKTSIRTKNSVLISEDL